MSVTVRSASPAISVPLGAGCEWYTATPPLRFLFPYGQAISRTTYAALFALWSTQFGVGDGSTTFNMPDLRGRGFAGLDNMGGTAADRLQTSVSLGTSSGSNAANVSSIANLTVGMYIFHANVPAGTTILSLSTAGGGAVVMSANATASGSATGRFSLINDPQTVGGVGGNHLHTTIETQIPAHTHVLRGDGTGGAGGARPYARYTNDGANTGATESAGSGQAHPNVQPTFMGYYIIRVL